MTRYHHLLMEFVCRTVTGVSPTAKSVLIHLACYTDETGTAYPTYDQLADLSGYSKRTVINAVKRSVEAGLITFQRGRSGRANTYRFTCLMEHSDCTDAVSAAPAPQEEIYNNGSELSCSISLSSWSAAPAPMEDAFAEFWALYPQKQAKLHARLAFMLAARQVEIDVIMGGLRKFLASDDSQREPRFIPLAHSWLTDERWDDEYD